MSPTPADWPHPFAHLPWAPAVRDSPATVVDTSSAALATKGVAKGDRQPASRAGVWSDRHEPATPAPTLLPTPKAKVPFQPAPSIPVADRAPLMQTALVSAAVALDVLATRAKEIMTSPEILADLATLMLELGALGGIDETARGRLIAHAAGRAGHARANLAIDLTTRLTYPYSAPAPAEATAVRAFAPSTPASVGRAIATVCAGSAVAIREASMRLEAARQTNAYKLV